MEYSLSFRVFDAVVQAQFDRCTRRGLVGESLCFHFRFLLFVFRARSWVVVRADVWGRRRVEIGGMWIGRSGKEE